MQKKGGRPTPGQDWPGPFFLIFLIFLMLPPTLWSIFYWKFGEWARAFGRMGAQYTHFFKLPLHLEVSNLPFLIELEILLFLNFYFH
jgi:hypothetical protein